MLTPFLAEEKLDTDNPDHISWLFSLAAARAKEFKIEGVTWTLTQGVVKNIIPAIASTNAIIAASCCNEAFKLATGSAPTLDNYMMMIGTDGVYSYTFQHERRPECPVCGGETRSIDVSKDWTVGQFIESLAERQDMCVRCIWRALCFVLTKSTGKSRSRRCRAARSKFTCRGHRS